METEIFLSSLGLAANCAVGSTVFKKFFYDIGLSATDKKLISNQVAKIIIQYNLTPENINIQPYQDKEQEYLEVQVLEVRLHDTKRYKRIAEIIMRTIPYPMILQLTQGQRLMVVAGMPRINLADRQKHSIEEFVFSPWMDSENLSVQDRDFLASIGTGKLSFTNFYRFYSDFVDQLHLFKAAKLAGNSVQGLDPQKARQLHKEIMAIESELAIFRSQLKKESMFNRKVELNVEIKRLETQIENIVESLRKQGV
jgi:hypothetical protein